MKIVKHFFSEENTVVPNTQTNDKLPEGVGDIQRKGNKRAVDGKRRRGMRG